MEHLVDIFQPEISFVVEEASGEVDGKHILAKVRGQFFVPEGVSRNKRYYPRSLWERVIGKVRDKLQNRVMFGTIGHEQNIGDTALLEGKVSHVVTDLYIDDKGRGIGEALILNTPAGRILNTLLRAGSKLFVSSRAEGKYSGTKNGVPVVDENSYDLKGFDFVVEPGFLQAQPQLVESLEKDISYCFEGLKGTSSDGGVDMDLLEAKVKENLKLQEELNKALEELEEYKKKASVLEAKEKELKEKLEEATRELEELKGLKAELEKYRQIGSVDEIDEALDKAKRALEEYKELGSPSEIEEALDEAISMLSQYKELGSPEEVEEALSKAKETLEKYQELGSPSEIEEVFSKTEEMIKQVMESMKKQKVEELADELNVPVEAIEKVYGKMSEDEIREFFKEFSEQLKIKEKYRKKEDKDDDFSKGSLFESRGERLLNYFARS